MPQTGVDDSGTVIKQQFSAPFTQIALASTGPAQKTDLLETAAGHTYYDQSQPGLPRLHQR
jgi:hypothetical protein